MKRHKFKFFIFIAVLVVCGSCRKNLGQNDEKILRVAVTSEIPTLDPVTAYDTVSSSAIYQVYETLYQYHYLKRPYTLEPLLAAEMPKIEGNGKRYIIKIKSGVRYHDDPAFKGQPRYVEAEDFITQLKRVAFIPSHSTGWGLFEGRIKGIDEFRKAVGEDFGKFKIMKIEGVKALDKQTLQIDLAAPYPQMLYAFAMTFTSPMPIEVVEFYNNKLYDHVVGTGPFVFQEWKKDSYLKLKRNAFYREEFYPSQGDRQANEGEMLNYAGKRLPFLSGIEFQFYKNPEERWPLFMEKKLDFLPLPKTNFAQAIDSSGQLSQQYQKKNIRLLVSPAQTYWWISFNMKDPLFGKNKNLRLAIAHAIDFDRFVQVFTNNVGQRANSIFPPGIPGYTPTARLPYRYDLNKAKEYLRLAGFPDGKGLPTINFDESGAGNTEREQAEFIKAELAKVGIKINPVLNLFPVFLEKGKKGELQLFQDGWSLDYPDAENCLQLLYGKNHAPGPNTSAYANPEVDRLIERIKLLNDGPEKAELMTQIEKLVNADIPWVMIYYSRNYTLVHDYVKNFRYSDLIFNYYKYIDLNSN